MRRSPQYNVHAGQLSLLLAAIAFAIAWSRAIGVTRGVAVIGGMILAIDTYGIHAVPVTIRAAQLLWQAVAAPRLHGDGVNCRVAVVTRRAA